MNTYILTWGRERKFVENIIQILEHDKNYNNKFIVNCEIQKINLSLMTMLNDILIKI